MTSVFEAQILRGINEKLISKQDALFVLAAIDITGGTGGAADLILKYGEKKDGDIDIILDGYSMRQHKMISKRIINSVGEISISINDLPEIQ